MTDKIFIFDNGSVGSKLLQHDYKDQYDIDLIKVNKSDDLVEQFTKIDNKDGIKIFLPFCVEELAADNEKKRKEIQKVESLGFRNLIVLPYEGRDEKTLNFKAKEAGIEENSKENLKVNDEIKKPYKTVRTYPEV